MLQLERTGKREGVTVGHLSDFTKCEKWQLCSLTFTPQAVVETMAEVHGSTKWTQAKPILSYFNATSNNNNILLKNEKFKKKKKWEIQDKY